MRRTTLSLCLIATVACGRATPPRDVNLLLISIDTLRADHLGAYGNDEWGVSPSPTIDALAARGVLVNDCYAPRGQTHPSLASMLTGKYPITHGLRENGHSLQEEHTGLFEHLAAAGYDTGVFAANLRVNHRVESWSSRGARVSGNGYEGRAAIESRKESAFQSVWDSRVERQALDFFDAAEPDRPFAMWVHFYDVHKPYNPPETHRRRFGFDPDIEGAINDPGPNSGQALELQLKAFTLGHDDPTEAQLRRVRGLYDETLAATDDRVARLLERLEERGELENTIVVITADHGEELYDHNRYFFHGASIYDGVVKIPFILAGPGLPEGHVVDGLSQNVDMAPTLLSMLELPADAAHEGFDLSATLRGERDDSPRKSAYIEWQGLIYAVRHGDKKLIVNSEHTHPRKTPWVYNDVPVHLGFEIDCVEAYDLGADPLESMNLLEGAAPTSLHNAPAPWNNTYRVLTDWIAHPDHRQPFGDRGNLSATELEEMQNHLEQLGYLGSGGANQEPCEEDG
ncbi:MAG: sulfatase [Planctomycetota bacterium]|nr:MAG: sulfatase [Planctomycetota bacterium]